MTTTVQLNSNATPEFIQKLNHIFFIHESFQPHVIAASTGITLQQSELFLQWLHTQGCVRKWFYGYHNCAPVPICQTPEPEKSWKGPFVCPECDMTIAALWDIRWEPYYLTSDHLRFEVRK